MLTDQERQRSEATTTTQGKHAAFGRARAVRRGALEGGRGARLWPGCTRRDWRRACGEASNGSSELCRVWKLRFRIRRQLAVFDESDRRTSPSFCGARGIMHEMDGALLAERQGRCARGRSGRAEAAAKDTATPPARVPAVIPQARQDSSHLTASASVRLRPQRPTFASSRDDDQLRDARSRFTTTEML